MTKCTFCGNEYDIPKGTTEITETGKVRHFCSSKCRKNYALGRDPKKVKWTKSYAIFKKKRAEKATKNS